MNRFKSNVRRPHTLTQTFVRLTFAVQVQFLESFFFWVKNSRPNGIQNWVFLLSAWHFCVGVARKQLSRSIEIRRRTSWQLSRQLSHEIPGPQADESIAAGSQPKAWLINRIAIRRFAGLKGQKRALPLTRQFCGQQLNPSHSISISISNRASTWHWPNAKKWKIDAARPQFVGLICCGFVNRLCSSLLRF